MAHNKANHRPASLEKENEKPKPPLLCTDVKKLSKERISLVTQMLTDGATFEDTVEAVNETEEEKITLRAVENFFRSNHKLQQSRIRRQVETARKLKAALTDPKSGQSELAEAVLFTGLMGLNKRSAGAQLQQAFKVKDQQENLRLKEETFRLKSERFDLDRKMLETRLKAEQAKLELLTGKVTLLKQTAEREAKGNNLSPEIIKQIHEIYGLVSPIETLEASQEKTDVAL